MIIDGEKWACEACVRGHRVSNCQHSDRPLQHINKKGRPVSQCQHCRAMRKSRSSHVKCDCGEKTSKCAHLQPTVEGHTETCCCNHGGRCSCSHKKELHPILDTVPESDSDGELRNKGNGSRPKLVARRRRANTVHSETMFNFGPDGNRQSSAKHRPSQKVGPYGLNRVNSANSACSLGAGSDSMAEVRRGASQRRVKSEAASPLISAAGFAMAGGVTPLDLSAIEYPAYNVANPSFDLFGNDFSPDHDGPMYSAGLSAASVDWSHYDLHDAKRAGNFTPSSYSHTGTHGFPGFDFGSGSEQLPHLVNTTSTSGDVSEVEDYISGADGDYGRGFLRQGSMMGHTADLTTIDYDSFCKTNDQSTMPGPGMSMVEEDPAFWMPNYSHDRPSNVDESPDPLGPPTMGNFWEL